MFLTVCFLLSAGLSFVHLCEYFAPNSPIVVIGTGYFAEGVLFGSAGLIIIIEYYRSEAKSLRSKLKQEKKEEKERKELEDRFQMLEIKIDALLKQNEERLKVLKKRADKHQQGWWGWFS